MKWGLWSTTAGSNSATPPDGWPEGQAPSTVNDCAREMMAQIKTGILDIAKGFVDVGMSPTFVSSTKFTTPNNDLAYFPIGSRVRANDSTTLYGTIISASFSTNSAFTVTWDTGSATSSLSSLGVSVIKPSDANGNLPSPLHLDGAVTISSTVSIPFNIVTNNNGSGLWMRCSGGAKLMYVNSASVWNVANSANTVTILTLTDAGALTAANDITAFSDERLKEDWGDLPEDFVEMLASIKRSGTFYKDGERHVGVGAQSLAKFLPEAVRKNEDGILSVAYGNAALASCVMLARRIIELQNRITQLESGS